MIVKIGCVQNEPGLFANDFGEARVRIAESVYADSSDQVEVAFAGGVVHVAALTAV